MYLCINKNTTCTVGKILSYYTKFIWLVHLCTKHSLYCQTNPKYITAFITSQCKNNCPKYQATNNNKRKVSQISHRQRFPLRKKHLQLTMTASMHLSNSTKVKA